jgi:hypothetical protein
MTGRTYPPTTEEANFFRTFIGTALRQAWEAFDWPEQTITQQEFFAPTYSALESYSFGDVVYWPTEQKYYQWINDASSSGEPPTFDADYFFVLGLEDGVTALGLEHRGDPSSWNNLWRHSQLHVLGRGSPVLFQQLECKLGFQHGV